MYISHNNKLSRSPAYSYHTFTAATKHNPRITDPVRLFRQGLKAFTMADDPDLSPDERPKKVVVLRLPPDVLERGTTTRTTQPVS